MLENTNTKQFYPGPILNNTLEITKFLFTDNTQIHVTYTTLNADNEPEDRELTYGEDYEVEKVLSSDINAAEAALTASTGVVKLKNLSVKAGEKITVYRETPLIQDMKYPRTGAFPAASHEGALDSIVMQNQEQQEQIQRSLKVPISVSNFTGDMPSPVPGRTLKISADASRFELSDLDVDEAYVSTNQYKAEAQAAKEEAINQANIAITQAGIATTQAGAAAVSAQEAADTLANAVTTINSEKNKALTAIDTQEESSVKIVKSQETTSINAIKSQQTTSVNAVKNEGTTQVNLAKAEVTKATTQANNAANSASQAADTLATAQTTINTEKTNAVKAVQSQQNSSVNTVKSTGQSYVDKCKAWASSDRAVEGGLYSAKHYAEMAQGKSDVTYEHLRASRVYNDKGMLLTDEEGYADVAEMNRSTFDRTKFSVAGSPTITSDGVASGFSVNNYITSNSVNLSTINWEIKSKFTTGVNENGVVNGKVYALSKDFTNEARFGIGLGFVQDGKFEITDTNDDATAWGGNALSTIIASPNTTYYTKHYFDGTNIKLDISTDGINYTNIITKVQTNNFITFKSLEFGSLNKAVNFTGSIDLKQFSITVDGKEVFNGNKTGLDVIKPDNYTVVGSPVITDDGVASGFLKDTETGYDSDITSIVTSDFKLKQLENKSWRIECIFTIDHLPKMPLGDVLYSFKNSDITQSWIAWSFSLQLENIDGYRLKSEARFGDKTDYSGNITIFSEPLETLGIIRNKYYKYVAMFNGIDTYTNKIIDVENGEVITSFRYKPTTTNKNLFMVNTQPEGTIRIGSGNRGYTSQWSGWSGSIDLNSFKIYVDGQLVYQPCLKIPYNLSKNDAKVVPAHARDRVLDVNENHDKGYAYYTIDEENKNFTLPLGTTFDNSLRRNLENITENGNEKLATSLMYETGNVSNDEKGFNQLAKMNRSTFDLSKFTVVGSPMITSDGVIINPSGPNGIQARNLNLEGGKTLTLKTEFTWNGTNPPQSTWISSLNTASNTNAIRFYQGFDGQISLYTIADGQEYYGLGTVRITPNVSCKIFIELKEESITLKVYQNNVLIKNNTSTDLKKLPKIFENGVIDKFNTSERILKGSIDLKQFSITVDGKEVFNGNKTGLDVIKENNFEVVGSPTITSDGVASGFEGDATNVNSIEIPTNFSIVAGSNTTYKFTYKFRFIDDGIVGQPLLWFFKNNEMKRFLYYSCNNAASPLGITFGMYDLSASYTAQGNLFKNNTVYDLLLETNFENYYNIYINNRLAIHKEFSHTFENYTITKIVVGALLDTAVNTYSYNAGLVDLNSIKIYVNDQLVYQPCLKIPYNVSKTGSKIVPAYARDRVIDLYEQEGHAGYYTIDEEKKNFTLPMGEIFGLIGHRSLRSVTRDGANYCEIYSDKTIEQGGTCTANTEVTLQQPFADRNYVLSVPYSSKTETSFIPTQTGDWIAKGKGV